MTLPIDSLPRIGIARQSHLYLGSGGSYSRKSSRNNGIDIDDTYKYTQ